MKQHTTSVAVNRELSAMAETPVKADNSKIIIAVVAASVVGFIAAMCLLFGVNIN